MTRPNSPHAAKTILICEDDPNLRTLVRLALGNGYDFVEAADGDSAIEQLETAPPDLVILDLMLPGRTGIEILHELRRRERHEATPVVVISAWSHSDVAAVAAGADCFVPKPFDPEELHRVVGELLEREGAHD